MMNLFLSQLDNCTAPVWIKLKKTGEYNSKCQQVSENWGIQFKVATSIIKNLLLVWAHIWLHINWSVQLWVVFTGFCVFFPRASSRTRAAKWAKWNGCSLFTPFLESPCWYIWSSSRSRSILIILIILIAKTFVAVKSIFSKAICDWTLIKDLFT